jgi:hypothetical protein
MGRAYGPMERARKPDKRPNRGRANGPTGGSGGGRPGAYRSGSRVIERCPSGAAWSLVAWAGQGRQRVAGMAQNPATGARGQDLRGSEEEFCLFFRPLEFFRVDSSFYPGIPVILQP